MRLGRMCKRLLDAGRVRYLRSTATAAGSTVRRRHRVAGEYAVRDARRRRGRRYGGGRRRRRRRVGGLARGRRRPRRPLRRCPGYAAAEAAEAAAAFVPVASSVRVDELGGGGGAFARAQWVCRGAARRGWHAARAARGVRPCADLALAQLDALLQAARRAGVRPRRDVFRFREICSRRAGGLRYDMRVPLLLDGEAAAGAGRCELGGGAGGSGALGRPCSSAACYLERPRRRRERRGRRRRGGLSSRCLARPTSTSTQMVPRASWSTASRPLVDDAALGPTELRPGSHEEAKTDDDGPRGSGAPSTSRSSPRVSSCSSIAASTAAAPT